MGTAGSGSPLELELDGTQVAGEKGRGEIQAVEQEPVAVLLVQAPQAPLAPQRVVAGHLESVVGSQALAQAAWVLQRQAPWQAPQQALAPCKAPGICQGALRGCLPGIRHSTRRARGQGTNVNAGGCQCALPT